MIDLLDKTDLRIDLGCGDTKKEGTIGLDFVAGPEVDYVIDLTTESLPFADRSVGYIHSSHFLEHIKNHLPVFREINRVAMDGAELEFWTPYVWSNPAFIIGHDTYISEDFYLHFQQYSDFWRGSIGAYWTIREIRYVILSETLEYLYKKGISVDFAVRHLKDVAFEFCVFITVNHTAEKPDFPPFKRTFSNGRAAEAFVIKEDFGDPVDPETVYKAIVHNAVL